MLTCFLDQQQFAFIFIFFLQSLHKLVSAVRSSAAAVACVHCAWYTLWYSYMPNKL